MAGRWTIFVCEACGEATGRHKGCDNAKRTATQVVPADKELLGVRDKDGRLHHPDDLTFIFADVGETE
jgi:hypothetical protein